MSFEHLVEREDLCCADIVKNLSSDLDCIDVSIIEKVCVQIDALDDPGKIYFELATVCRDKSYLHPQWSLLSGRVMMLQIKKNVPKTRLDIAAPFLDKVYLDFCKEHADELDEIIDPERDWTFDIFAVGTLLGGYLMKSLSKEIVNSILETPQMMYLRVAVFLWMESGDNLSSNSIRKIKETYDDFSLKLISLPSPIMFNAGTKKPQMSSCFLKTQEDSMDSIIRSWGDVATLSQGSGGIGLVFDALRHSEIGLGGKSKGIIPWIKIQNEVIGTVDQAGKRKGSGTMYTTDWNIDIFEFIDLKDPNGPPELRARDLFYGLMITDLFMERVAKDSYWSLVCPAKVPGLEKTYGKEFEKLYVEMEALGGEGKLGNSYRRVRARDLWSHILSSQIRHGMPFIIYKDNVNRKSPQQNLGTIRMSNLCVAGDTKILTDEGYLPIKSLRGKNVNVWNGKEWSNVKIHRTGRGVDLLKVTCSDGTILECTQEHKFYLQKTYRSTVPKKVDAQELKKGDMLVKFDLPEAIEFKEPEKFLYPYTHGFYCGDGTDNKNKTGGSVRDGLRASICLYGEKIELLDHLEFRSTSGELTAQGRLNVTLHHDIEHKFVVPSKSSISDRIRWLEGLCDADGTISRNGTNESLQIGSIEFEFLTEIKLMLQTLGIISKVTITREGTDKMMPDGKGGEKSYTCKKLYRLLISSIELQKLAALGFNPKRLKFELRQPQRNASQFIKIVSVEEGRKGMDTFCFTEPKQHMGMFNGIITGQCTEIVLYSNENEIASCTLSSIPVSKFVVLSPKGKSRQEPHFDFDQLGMVTRRAIRNLGQVIDRNYYSTRVPQVKYSNFRHRPIGIGIQDLAGCFAMMDYCWGSDDCMALNEKIARTMYYHGMEENVKMAEEFGYYPTFPGSPASRGLFQMDLWELERMEKAGELESGDHRTPTSEEIQRVFSKTPKEFIPLRERMIKSGLYFSNLFAQMPTASSASILGNNESIEPYTQLIGTRTILGGQFMMHVPQFVKDLQDIDMWNVKTLKNLLENSGSIQNYPEDDIEDPSVLFRMRYIKNKYATAFEMSQKIIADLYLARAKYQCQSSSNNVFIPKPTMTSLSAYHTYMHRNGAKTGIYYLRTLAGVKPLCFSIDDIEMTTNKITEANIVENGPECLSCHS